VLSEIAARTFEKMNTTKQYLLSTIQLIGIITYTLVLILNEIFSFGGDLLLWMAAIILGLTTLAQITFTIMFFKEYNKTAKVLSIIILVIGLLAIIIFSGIFNNDTLSPHGGRSCQSLANGREFVCAESCPDDLIFNPGGNCQGLKCCIDIFGR
jgi:amino acid transporter